MLQILYLLSDVIRLHEEAILDVIIDHPKDIFLLGIGKDIALGLNLYLRDGLGFFGLGFLFLIELVFRHYLYDSWSLLTLSPILFILRSSRARLGLLEYTFLGLAFSLSALILAIPLMSLSLEA